MKQQRMDPAAAGAASNAVAAGQEEKVPSAWRKHYARLLQLRGKVIQLKTVFLNHDLDLCRCAEMNSDLEGSLKFLIFRPQKDRGL